MVRKDEVRRRRIDIPAGKTSGKAAELIRRLRVYQDAKRVFVGPGARMQQVRINALTDGKELLVPAPGLKDGFYLLMPYEIPFKSLNYAVGFKGVLQYGQRVAVEELCRTPAGLLVTDCLAVDSTGYLVGDGNGFFDLAVAILAEFQGIAPEAEVYGLGEREQMLDQEIERDAWDVRCNGFVTPEGVALGNAGGHADSRVLWDMLSLKRIRKITPLWKLSMRAQDALAAANNAP